MSKKKIASPTLSKKKVKPQKIDGFGPVEKMQARNALRLVWQRSRAWKIVKDRCKDEDGYPKCEKCKQRVPKIKVDHIVAIGDIEDLGFLARLFVDSSGLQGLCDPCHKPKTKKDNAKTKEDKALKKIRLATNPPGKVEDIVPGGVLYHLEVPREHWPIEIKEERPKFDADIEEMELFTYEKIEIQKDRDKNRIKTLDMFI